MAVNHETFVSATEFINLPEPDFEMLQALIEPELSRINWGNLRDSAFIALLSYKLKLKQEAEDKQTEDIKEFERRDDGYRVSYSDKGKGSTKYLTEYQRLVALASNSSSAAAENLTQFHSASRKLIQPKGRLIEF